MLPNKIIKRKRKTKFDFSTKVGLKLDHDGAPVPSGPLKSVYLSLTGLNLRVQTCENLIQRIIIVCFS